MASLAVLATVGIATAQYDDRYLGDPIRYEDGIADNPVARLQQQLAAGSLSLAADPQWGYLPAVLEALDIPIDSQVLVFSKTSLQIDRISPTTPRAIYFNDDTYVGAVRNGAQLEISTSDPALGTVFYTLTQESADAPHFAREIDTCLQCHAGAATRGIPGHLIRSVYTTDTGFPLLSAGSFITTQESPFAERWGGWYVTGTHGEQHHMGNVFAVKNDNGRVVIDPEGGANRRQVPPDAAVDRYLSPHSDLIALMVLEHQTRMHNLLTEATFVARQALFDQAVMDDILNRQSDELSESTQRRIAAVGDRLVDYMLFVDETELTSPIAGTSGFAQTFAARGPKDSQGRSLRDLDLETRLFRYPLSYLIYSPQFDGLPEPMKDYVYRRLWKILTGEIDTKDYLHLTNAISRDIREILVETKAGIPDYWRYPQGS